MQAFKRHINWLGQGRCDWDCDSVLARIAQLGLLYGHRSGERGAASTAYCGSYGVARLREGSRKNGIEVMLTCAVMVTRAREALSRMVRSEIWGRSLTRSQK